MQTSSDSIKFSHVLRSLKKCLNAVRRPFAHSAARPVATMVAPADPAAAGGPGFGDAKTRAESERSADALFESRSLDEIREVRARAARDAEAKDEELRQRVGSSYRDAIATADCVLEMETTAARATETLDCLLYTSPSPRDRG